MSRDPELQAALERIEAVWMQPRPRPLERILHKMAASGRGLIVDDGTVIVAPLDDDNSFGVAA